VTAERCETEMSPCGCLCANTNASGTVTEGTEITATGYFLSQRKDERDGA